MFELEGIDHVALAVRDPARSAAWYIEVLGFEHRLEGMWGGVPLFVGKGTTALALFPLQTAEAKPRPRSSITMLHLAFRTGRAGFQAAQEEFRKRGIAFEFQDHEVSQSIYFQDPDGHELEITTYELEGRAPSRRK
ncbi:FosA family fosfomycin resistance glutathione transferase [soil metagenome]